MFYLKAPTRLAAQFHSTVPGKWAIPRHNEWAKHNRQDEAIGSFLEGPCFDPTGNLLMVDVAFGRIFRISRDGSWSILAKYEGWPNGLKCTADGRIIVADHRLGLVEITEHGHVIVLLSGYHGESFRGLNDLIIGTDGWIYFTDQGQSGLQEPVGCVYRWHLTFGKLERIVSNIPSPNGLVLSNDGAVLYVAVTRANAIWRVPFVGDGGVSKVGVFLNLSGGGGPDGITTDLEGGLIVAQPGIGVLRFDKHGMLSHFVDLPASSSVSNLAFEHGGSRRLVMVDSASGSVYEVEMPFAGIQ